VFLCINIISAFPSVHHCFLLSRDESVSSPCPDKPSELGLTIDNKTWEKSDYCAGKDKTRYGVETNFRISQETATNLELATNDDTERNYEKAIGVYLDKKRNLWRASLRFGKLRKTRNFRIAKWGMEGVRNMAIMTRTEMLKQITDIHTRAATGNGNVDKKIKLRRKLN